VGLTAVASSPNIDFQTFAKGWAAGAAKGGAFGLVSGLIEAMDYTTRNPPSGVYGQPSALVTQVILTTVSTVIWGIAGGMEAVPRESANQAEAALIRALGDVRFGDDLARQVERVSAARPALNRYDVTLLDEASPEATGAPTTGAGHVVDSVVEIRITDAGFRGGRGAEPEVRLYLNARIRLLAAATGAEIYTRDFQFMSQQRPFADWFADGSRQLTAGFAQAVDVLAERIVDELFLVTGFPFSSGLWALPGQPEFGTCWFRPIDPGLRYSTLWDSIRHNEPGIKIRYTAVDSLRPLLRWEPFPRPRDMTPDNDEVLQQISKVSYDLKIWQVAGDYPERLVFDISGLDLPEYRPDVDLQPRTEYFWTFRARFDLSGQPQVSRWAFSNIPANTPDDYPVRRPGGSCDLDAIPLNNYFRFVTP